MNAAFKGRSCKTVVIKVVVVIKARLTKHLGVQIGIYSMCQYRNRLKLQAEGSITLRGDLIFYRSKN